MKTEKIKSKIDSVNRLYTEGLYTTSSSKLNQPSNFRNMNNKYSLKVNNHSIDPSLKTEKLMMNKTKSTNPNFMTSRMNFKLKNGNAYNFNKIESFENNKNYTEAIKEKPVIYSASDYSSEYGKILHELDILDLGGIVKNIDPSFESDELLDHIQDYERMIRKEISIIKEKKIFFKDGFKKKRENEKKVQEIKLPPMDNFIYSYKEAKERGLSYNKSDLPVVGKTKVDYRLLIQSLENEIVYSHQKINNEKFNNVVLSREVEEIRKNLMYTENKLKDVMEKYNELEKEHENQKETCEKISKKAQDQANVIELISNDQQNLKNLKDKMLEEIKATDEIFTKKAAMIKYFNHELKQIEIKEQLIRSKKQREFNEFYAPRKAVIEQINK